jgi:type IV pilus assembly protein PilO
MNQAIDQLAKLSLPNKVIALVVLMVIIGFGYYIAFYSPLEETLSQLEKKQEELNEKLMENQAIAQNHDKFEEELAVLDEELKQALNLLPNDSDIRTLLRQISVLQKKTNVTNLMFKPGGEVRKGFYAEIPIELKLEGTYHDIALFFDKVGKLERIVNLSDIELGSPKSINGKIILNVSCMATTFKFIGGAGVPRGGARKG